jgi:integrase
MKPLTPTTIEALPAGVHRIASGLYLKRLDRKSGAARSILFRWHRDGRGRVLSLGPWARERYADFLAQGARYQEAVTRGEDPTIERERSSAPGTFGEAATAFYDQATFRSAKHLEHCRTSMIKVGAVLGDMPVATIQTEHVARALRPMWLKTPVTARTVRQRVEEVLDFAFAKAGIEKFNPASRGRLKHLLPKHPKHVVKHHKALAYRDLPQFYASLRTYYGEGSERERNVQRLSMVTQALRFLVLTAARTNEVLGARWEEIDFKTATWSVPSERLKTGREHRVALSRQALDLLRPLRALELSDYVFPGNDLASPLGGGALGQRLRDLGYRRVFTVHGFRSSFKDWCREQTEFRWELVELSLSHEIGSTVERSYGRSDLLHLRRPLAETWGDFVSGKPAGLRVVHRKA